MPKYAKIYEEAMKHKAPRMHAELKANGTLEEHLDEKQQEAEDNETALMSKMQQRNPLPEDFMERVKRLNQDAWTAREIVMSELTEFPTED